MSMATWQNLHDAIFEIEEKLFSRYNNISACQTDLTGENNVSEERE